MSLRGCNQVLMLDSDNLPLRNPEYLFSFPQYQQSGSLFFSDWWDMVEWVKPEAYKAFGLEFPGDLKPTLAAESGQVLLDRRAHCSRKHPCLTHPPGISVLPCCHSAAG
jgi:hypothetical protein